MRFARSQCRLDRSIPIDTPRKPIDFGELRRVTPIDADFGVGRGKPVDRHYIEGFLARHAGDVQGRVLEVASDDYTRRYGEGRITQADILHVDSGNPRATIVADLAEGAGLPSGAFDCFICTQTLQYLWRPADAFATIERILRPGGVLLLSVPGISQISPFDRDRWGEHWRFTPQSVERLAAQAFGAGQASVQGHGNVLAAIAFLHGLACADLSVQELDANDDRYPMLITARVQKKPS